MANPKNDLLASQSGIPDKQESDSPDALKEKMALLEQENTALKQQKKQLAKTEKRLEAIEKRLSDRGRDPEEFRSKSLLEKHQAAERRWHDGRSQQEDKAVTELLDGPNLFTVKIEGNPERLVGAENIDEAGGKYRRFFRINATGHKCEVVAIGDDSELDKKRHDELVAVRGS